MWQISRCISHVLVLVWRTRERWHDGRIFSRGRDDAAGSHHGGGEYMLLQAGGWQGEQGSP
jgi:hypothetical protein